MKKILRKIHRWLGLLMALQIIAWMVSGLYFAWFPINEIRGSHLRSEPAPLDLALLVREGQVPGSIEQSINDLPGLQSVESINLVTRDGQPWYRVGYRTAEGTLQRLIEPREGLVKEALTEQQARAAAIAALEQPGTVKSVHWLTEAVAGSEFRGRALPLWQVEFEQPESATVYMHPWTAEILAVRTERWRIFDFLWMLHIMDFDERDDFNTPLLQIAAALGLVIALSGLVYWALTSRLFRGRRSRQLAG